MLFFYALELQKKVKSQRFFEVFHPSKNEKGVFYVSFFLF